MSEWSLGKNEVLVARSAWMFMSMGEMATCGAKLLLEGGSFFCATVLDVFSGQSEGRNREQTYDYQSVAAFQDPLISVWSWNEYSSGKAQPVLASSTSSLSPSWNMFPTPLSMGDAKLGCDVLYIPPSSADSATSSRKNWHCRNLPTALGLSFSFYNQIMQHQQHQFTPAWASWAPHPRWQAGFVSRLQRLQPGPPRCISAHMGRRLLKSSLYQLVSASQLENCLVLYEAEQWDWVHTLKLWLASI